MIRAVIVCFILFVFTLFYGCVETRTIFLGDNSKALELDWVFPSSGLRADVNLVGLWHFDDTNSDNWTLNSATGLYDGNVFGGASTMGVGLWDSNSASLTPSSGDFINLGNFAFPGSSSFSVWFKSMYTGSSQCPFFSFNSGFFCYSLINSNLRCATDGGSVGNPDFGGVKHDGVWHHLVLTTSGSVSKAYIDGVLGASWNETRSTTTKTFYLGGYYPANYNFVGLIEDFAMWKRELSADEVNDLYELGHFKNNLIIE